MNACELIGFRGYVCETHTVQTADGYILTLQRIPRPLSAAKGDEKAVKEVVFLQHGLLCDSTNWITNFKNQSLAFVLSDAGYDVWLGNFRGNTYSLKHVNLTTKDHAFWQFSWDHMAEYDLPAMIDYVLKTTGQTQVQYVGHSQGTMTMFAKLTHDQDFAKKIKTFFALAPVSTVGHIKGPLKLLGRFTDSLEWILENLGIDQFLPTSWLTHVVANMVCGFAWTNPICVDVLFLLVGPDISNLNSTRLPVYIAHTPSGTSTQNMVHFGQMTKSNKYCKFDYGKKENIERYGQPTPPEYDLTKVNAPTVLFYGPHDWLADPTDVAQLLGRLPTTTVAASYVLDKYNHMDFIWGLQANKDVYQKILHHMKS